MLNGLFSKGLLFAVCTAGLVAACGSDSNTTKVDAAPVVVDAPKTIDAPTALVGLGQKCNAQMPCTAPATCLSTQGAQFGFCSTECHHQSGWMTDANKQIVPASVMITPADDAKCTATYTGTVGTASCFLPLNIAPAPVNGMLAANTAYKFDAYCQIDCGAGNTCPTGLTCNTAAGICAP